jgi:hypothetical protein
MMLMDPNKKRLASVIVGKMSAPSAEPSESYVPTEGEKDSSLAEGSAMKDFIAAVHANDHGAALDAFKSLSMIIEDSEPSDEMEMD